MQLTEFKVLSFSCYGTLIDREAGIYTALKPLLNTARVSLSREDALERFTRYESAQQAETPTMLYCSVLSEVHRRLAKEWGVIVSDDDHALFGKSVPLWPVFADAPAALQYLKRYFKLVVLSNIDRENFVATHRKLETRFDAVYTAEEIGSYKPDVKNFEHMLARVAKLGFGRADILHVADNLLRDHAPAASCGLASAWIDRSPQHAQEGAAIASTWTAGRLSRFTSIVDMVKSHQELLVHR